MVILLLALTVLIPSPSVASALHAGWTQQAPATPLSTPAVEIGSRPHDVRIAVHLEQSWQYTGERQGGFGDVGDFTDPTSLYATFWTLSATRLNGTEVPVLDPEKIVQRFQAAISHPEREPELPTLDAILLATRGLRLLETAPSTNEVSDQVERLRSGWGYAREVGEDPSWSATADAIEILGIASAPIPPDIARALTDALPRTTNDPAALGESRSDFVAQWAAANPIVPSELRIQLYPQLTTVLQAIINELAVADCVGGHLFGAATTVSLIAAENQVPLQYPDDFLSGCAASLLTPNGQLALFPDGQPNAAVTAQSRRLGRPLGPAFDRTVQQTAEPDGWRMPVSAVSPDSTYWGVAISQAMGFHHHDTAIHRQARQWLSELEASGFSPDTPFVGEEQVPYVLMLAKTLQVDIPASIRVRLEERLANPATLGWDSMRLAALLRSAIVIDSGKTEEVITALQGGIADGTRARPNDLAVLVILRDSQPSALHETLVADEVARLDLGGGLMEPIDGTGVAHLGTTVTALYGTDRLADLGTTVSPLFLSDEGYQEFPPEQGTDGVDLETTYLGFVLENRIAAMGWLP